MYDDLIMLLIICTNLRANPIFINLYESGHAEVQVRNLSEHIAQRNLAQLTSQIIKASEISTFSKLYSLSCFNNYMISLLDLQNHDNMRKNNNSEFHIMYCY